MEKAKDIFLASTSVIQIFIFYFLQFNIYNSRGFERFSLNKWKNVTYWFIGFLAIQIIINLASYLQYLAKTWMAIQININQALKC